MGRVWKGNYVPRLRIPVFSICCTCPTVMVQMEQIRSIHALVKRVAKEAANRNLIWKYTNQEIPSKFQVPNSIASKPPASSSRASQPAATQGMDAGLSPSPGGDPGRKSGKKDGGDADQPVGKDKVKVWDPKDPILRKVLAKEEAGDEAVHPKKTMYQILRGGNVRKLPPSQSHADVAWPSPPEDRVPPAEESNLPDGQHWVGDCPKKPQLHANDDPEMNLLMNELKEAVISREGSQQQGLLSGRFSGSLRMKDKPRTSSLWTMDTPSLNSYGRLSIEDEHDTGSFDDHDEECDSDYGSSLDDEISLGDEDEVNSNGLDAMAATIPFVNYLGMKIHQSRGVYKSGKPKRFERLKKSMVRGING